MWQSEAQTSRRMYHRGKLTSSTLCRRRLPAPEAGLRRCLQLFLPGVCGPLPHTSISISNLRRLEPLISLLDVVGEGTIKGEGGLGAEKRKAPAFTPTPQRNFWDSSITQPRDQVPIHEHLSARRGRNGQTWDSAEERWAGGRVFLRSPSQFF